MRTTTRTASFITGLVAASSLVSAAPAPAPKGFSLPAIHKRSNPGCIPARPPTASSNNSNGDGSASNSGGSANGFSAQNRWVDSEGEFVTEVKVGGQTLSLELDTGSTDMWIMSTNQKKFPDWQYMNQTNVRTYDPKAPGANFKEQPGFVFDTVYGDSTVVNCSQVGTESVEMGGLTVPDQLVALADVTTGTWERGSRHGIIGLASNPRVINTTDNNNFVNGPIAYNFVQKAYDEKLISKRSIAMYFKEPQGSYDIGMTDKSKYTGDIQYVNLSEEKDLGGRGLWYVPFKGFTAGDQTVEPDASKERERNAVIDSGNTLISVTEKMAEALYTQIPNSVKDNRWGVEFWSVPCDAVFPPISMKFGDLVLDLPNTKEVLIRNDDRVKGDNMCMGSIQPASEASMGTYFIRAYYTVFDFGEYGPNGRMTIGFAKRA